MKNIVFLDYMFMFDPSETWSHLFEFEKQFGAFLNEHGMEAEVIKTIEGSVGSRILLIKKKEEVANVEEKKPRGRPKFVGNNIRDLGIVQNLPLKK